MSKNIVDFIQDNDNMIPLSIETVHKFSDGVYYREITMPKNSLIVGHTHKTNCLNIMISGELLVYIDGQVKHLKAPCTFESKAGSSKVVFILEDTTWANVHPTTETDIEKLEELFIDKTATPVDAEEVYLAFTEELKCLGQ